MPFHYGRGSCVLQDIHAPSLLALSSEKVLRYATLNAIEIHNKMILDFHPGLPFLYVLIASLQLKCWSAKVLAYPLVQGLCITGCTGIHGSAKYNVIHMNQPIMEVYWYSALNATLQIKYLTWTNVHTYLMWELECFTYTCIYMGSTVRN